MLDYQHILHRIRKSKPRLGLSVDLENAKTAAKEIMASIDTLRSVIPNLSSINANVNKIIGEVSTTSGKLSAGLGLIQSYQSAFKEPLTDLAKSVTAFEESNTALNETFGITSATAKTYAQELRKVISGNQGVFDIGDEEMFGYVESLKDVTGGLVALATNTDAAYTKGNAEAKSMLKTQKLLVTNWKLTNEQAQAYQLYLAGNKENSETQILQQKTISKIIADSTGLDALAVQTDLTKEISNLTSDLQLQYSKIPGSLELAVFKSKALGISVSQLNKTGETLLDIQSSIGEEIKLQAISGRRLLVDGDKSLTDEYRKATIMGDISRQADLMNQFVKAEGDALRTNMLYRKQASTTLGIDEAALAKMVQKRELMVKLGAEQLFELKGDDLEAGLAKLRAEVADDPKRKAMFADLLIATDTRSSTEIANGLLAQIAANTSRELGKDIDVMEARGGLTKSLKNDGGLRTNITQFNESGVQTAMGNVGLKLKVIDTVYKPLETLGTKLPGIVKNVVDALKKLTTVNVATTATGTVPTHAAGGMLANGGMLPRYDDGGVLGNTVTHTDASVSGGVLMGPSHEHGGIPTRRGEVEGGEYIINKRSTEKYLPVIEMINASKGNPIQAFDNLMNSKLKNVTYNAVYQNKITNAPVTTNNENTSFTETVLKNIANQFNTTSNQFTKSTQELIKNSSVTQQQTNSVVKLADINTNILSKTTTPEISIKPVIDLNIPKFNNPYSKTNSLVGDNDLNDNSLTNNMGSSSFINLVSNNILKQSELVNKDETLTKTKPIIFKTSADEQKEDRSTKLDIPIIKQINQLINPVQTEEKKQDVGPVIEIKQPAPFIGPLPQDQYKSDTTPILTDLLRIQEQQALSIKDYKNYVTNDYASETLKLSYKATADAADKSLKSKDVTNNTTTENKTEETVETAEIKTDTPELSLAPVPVYTNDSQNNSIDYTKLATTIIDAIKTVKLTNTEWKQFADTVAEPISKALSTPIPVNLKINNDIKPAGSSQFIVNRPPTYGA